MSMIFNATAFSKLRPTGTGFRLPTWKKPLTPGHGTDNPLLIVLRFAGSAGLLALPDRTVRLLRDHPYYRYAFYPLVRQSDPYDPKSFFAEHDRPRLVELLKDPDQLNDQDIVRGIQRYLNNFTGYLPGGMYRDTSYVPPKIFEKKRPIYDAVDRAFCQLGKSKEEALALQSVMQAEGRKRPPETIDQAKFAPFMKLALAVFNRVVEEGQFDPAMLWR